MEQGIPPKDFDYVYIPVPKELSTHGHCNGSDLNHFYPKNTQVDHTVAKRHCSSCLVRVTCLNYALKADEKYGVWGGFGPRERKTLRKVIYG
jgi:WhiB family redox-sensing transcriptional regulator